MRHAAYLSTSRHGIFYFRLPIPPRLHPNHKNTDVRLSLGTRCPRAASRLSRLLIIAGQSMLARPIVQSMKYPDIRQHVQNHFRDRLAKFKIGVAESDPISDERLLGLKAVIGAAESDQQTFLNYTYIDDDERLLREFCEQEGITETLTSEDRRLILHDFQKAYLQHAKAALAHNANYSEFDLENKPLATPCNNVEDTKPNDRLNDVADSHILEGQRSGLWMAKTVTEKRDALKLLGQLTKNKYISEFTKADARAVKDALQRMPKNRNKAPATKGLTLDEMLTQENLPKASIRTLNGYMSNFQSFFKWAVEQGYVAENVFEGMRFRMPKRDKSSQRDAFTTPQLNVMFEHLTENPTGLVSKDEHKWVTLIAMFTGARLNEVAQLEVKDLLEHEGVWCLSFTTDGDELCPKVGDGVIRRHG